MSDDVAPTPPLPAVPLPWQSAAWQQLLEAHARAHLPHALLLAGAPGIGKHQFARALAHYLLCARPRDGAACGDCRQCHLSLAGTHPDLKWIAPEERGRQIRVDRIRELVAFLDHTAQQGGYKITVLEPADAMNPNAANALLKSLEEPAGQSLLILVTDSPGQLSATIRSRCQRVRLPSPDAGQSGAWLAQQLESPQRATELLAAFPHQPLRALALQASGDFDRYREWDQTLLAVLAGSESAVNAAEQWQQAELVDILDWLGNRVAGLIACVVAGAEPPADWAQRVAAVDARGLFLLLDHIHALNQQLRSGGNPNRQLALENLLLLSCDKFHNRNGSGPWRMRA